MYPLCVCVCVCVHACVQRKENRGAGKFPNTPHFLNDIIKKRVCIKRLLLRSPFSHLPPHRSLWSLAWAAQHLRSFTGCCKDGDCNVVPRTAVRSVATAKVTYLSHWDVSQCSQVCISKYDTIPGMSVAERHCTGLWIIWLPMSPISRKGTSENVVVFWGCMRPSIRSSKDNNSSVVSLTAASSAAAKAHTHYTVISPAEARSVAAKTTTVLLYPWLQLALQQQKRTHTTQ